VNIVSDLLYLFRGNPTVVGLDCAYLDDDEVPGPLRMEPDQAEQQWQVLMEGHLLGRSGIGVYPYNPRTEGVAWGCVDFDDGELPSWGHAIDLRLGLMELGITGFIERSKSKGYHVWVFFGGWVPAPLVRRLLVGTCQAVDVPSKEVNPKSATLRPDQLGNFVRLPFKGAVHPMRPPPADARQVVVDDLGKPISPGLFAALAAEAAVSVHELARAARRVHVVPEPLQAPLRGTYDGPWKDQLNALAKIELARGPQLGQDRSDYLFGFANACQESGLRPEDADKAIRLADYLHGQKYTNRKDADARYGELVRKSYTQAQEGA
jgi:hypothetical protein